MSSVSMGRGGGVKGAELPAGGIRASEGTFSSFLMEEIKRITESEPTFVQHVPLILSQQKVQFNLTIVQFLI